MLPTVEVPAVLEAEEGGTEVEVPLRLDIVEDHPRPVPAVDPLHPIRGEAHPDEQVRHLTGGSVRGVGA